MMADLIEANLKSSLKAVLAVKEKAAANKLFARGRLYLGVVLHRIVKEQLRIPVTLPHTLYDPGQHTVCLITKDAVGDDDNDKDCADYEASTRHYTALLEAEGDAKSLVDYVLPLRELTLCYQPYEARRKLHASYDFFLMDRRVAHRVTTKLGKSFCHGTGRHKFPIGVDMETADLAGELRRALSVTRLSAQSQGSFQTVLVGHCAMSETALADNVSATVRRLVVRLPGGAANIKSMYLRVDAGVNVPLYVSDATAAPPPPEPKTRSASVKVVLPASLY